MIYKNKIKTLEKFTDVYKKLRNNFFTFSQQNLKDVDLLFVHIENDLTKDEENISEKNLKRNLSKNVILRKALFRSDEKMKAKNLYKFKSYKLNY